MFKSGVKSSSEVVAEIHAAEAAILDAERRLADAEAEAHEAIIGGDDGERHSRNLAALRLRRDALRTAPDRHKAALRSALEREHAARRTEAESTLRECEASKNKMIESFIPVAVTLVKASGEAHGHAAAWRAAWVLRELAAGRCNVPQMGVREGFRTADDPLSRAVLAAIGDVEKTPDALTRRTAAQSVFDSVLDVDREVARLLPPPPPVEVPVVKPKAVEHFDRSYHYENPGDFERSVRAGEKGVVRIG